MTKARRHLLGEERSESMTSVLVIDLDRFQGGQRHARPTVSAINSFARSARVSARCCDEPTRCHDSGVTMFAVLLPDSGGPAAAHQVARRLISCLREPFMLGTLRFTIDATCGHATSPQDGTDIDALLQHATFAMYVGKAAHSGAVGYDPTLDVNCPARLAILNELPAAIRDGELVLQYQPKRDIRTGRVVGAEALVRWRHPARGLIAPDPLCPGGRAQRSHQAADELGDRRRAESVPALERRAASYGRAGLSVAVNVSARNLLDDNFPVEVREALDRHGVPAALSLSSR